MTLKSLLNDNTVSQVVGPWNISLATSQTMRNPGVGLEVSLEVGHLMGLAVLLQVTRFFPMTKLVMVKKNKDRDYRSDYDPYYGDDHDSNLKVPGVSDYDMDRLALLAEDD